MHAVSLLQAVLLHYGMPMYIALLLVPCHNATMCGRPPQYAGSSLLRFLAVLGEGVSSQVILAADTFRPAAPHVAIKILKRQYSYAGQKVSHCPASRVFRTFNPVLVTLRSSRGSQHQWRGSQALSHTERRMSPTASEWGMTFLRRHSLVHILEKCQTNRLSASAAGRLYP